MGPRTPTRKSTPNHHSELFALLDASAETERGLAVGLITNMIFDGSFARHRRRGQRRETRLSIWHLPRGVTLPYIFIILSSRVGKLEPFWGIKNLKDEPLVPLGTGLVNIRCEKCNPYLYY